MELKKLARLVKITLAVNVLLVLVNVCMFYAMLVFVVAEPSQVMGVASTPEPAEVMVEVDTRKELQDFFDRTTDLLDRTARKHSANPAEFVPTAQEVAEAVDTLTIHSDESQEVLQKLREGYDYFDLTWPIVMPRR